MRRVPLGRSLLLALLFGVIGGCRGCSGSGALSVEGAHPYVRCLAAEPPRDFSRNAGALSIRLHGRDLRIGGLSGSVTLAAFAGPAFGEPPGVEAVSAIAARKPALALLLGDVGDNVATTRATLGALAGLPMPTLVLAGGRDSPERIASALEALPEAARARIIDVTSLRTIGLGRDTLIPVPGSLDGRSVQSTQACGYSREDLDKVASEVGAASARRWLLASEAPAAPGRFGVARTETGVDLGSVPLAELAKRIGAPGGIFAWPHVQVLRASASAGAHRPSPGVPSPDLQVVVPRLSGGALERSDGSRVMPGFVLLRLDQDGMRLVQSVTIQR